MAESAIDRLKRLAAEKKVAESAAQPSEAKQEEKSDANERNSESVVDGTGYSSASDSVSVVDSGAGSNTDSTEVEGASSSDSSSLVADSSDGSSAGGVASVSGLGDPVTELAESPAPTKAPSDHPLAMQFAELELALNAKDPQFPTILRQIHRHLGQDAELVTMMTEEEVQLIVTGMVVFAQAEIVEPAKAKAAKAAVTKAGKKAITADDL